MSAWPNSPLQTTTNEFFFDFYHPCISGQQIRRKENDQRAPLLSVQNIIVYIQAIEEDNSIKEYLLRRLHAWQMEHPSQ